MLSSKVKQELEHQQYRIVANHSSVKICGWTRNMIRGRGSCYKHKFYGINSHQCLQMTTCLSCANRCVFCWRGHKEPVAKKWSGTVDEPQKIFEDSIKAHHQLLVGFKGSDKCDKQLYRESNTVKHVALSLTGEPIIYPRINELIDIFHKNEITTFLVTNGQYPEAISNLKPVTQLYLSLDAPTPKLLKKVDKPLFSDYWERLLQSLDHFAEKKGRTCVRLTIIKGINDKHFKEYAELIQRGNFDFVEVKAYMFLGESRQRLKEKNMPLHEHIVEFSKQLAGHLPSYEMVTEHIPSRVVLLAKKMFKKKGEWHTGIDFDKFFKEKRDYSSKTPETSHSK